MAPYEYRPLRTARHIRLLTILKPKRKATPDLHLQHFCLDDVKLPDYEPVSYTWKHKAPKTYIEDSDSDSDSAGDGSGDESPESESGSDSGSDANHATDETICPDETISLSDGRSLQVSFGLAKALPHLFAASTTKRLWIDQLCIDQANHEERSKQIALMHFIYARGYRTLIWLGDGTRDSDFMGRVLEIIGSVHKQYALKVSVDSQSDEDWATKYEMLFEELRLQRTSRLYFPLESALFGLWKRRWFTRVWIVQELLFSSKAMFLAGDQCFAPNDIDRFYKLVGHIWKHNEFTGSIGRRSTSGLSLFYASLTEDPNQTSLAYYLRSRRSGQGWGSSQATDPRDTVYAMINLSEPEPWLPAVNYRYSTAQVFSEAAKYLIQSEGCLAVLELSDNHWRDAESSAALLEELPSWVPDWSTKAKGPSLHNSFWFGSEFKANAGRRHVSAVNDDWKVLTTRGYIIDKITWAATTHDFWSDFGMDELRILGGTTTSGQDVLNLAGLAARINRQTRGHHTSATRLLRIVTHGYRLQKYRRYYRASSPTYEHDPVSLDAVEAAYFSSESYQRRSLLDVRERLTDSLNAAIGRKFFLGSRGRLGLAPRTAQVDDLLVVLHGCATPVVLRPEGTGYRFIGVCYYENAMFGEAASLDESDATCFQLI